MRPNHCLTILHVSILTPLLLTLDADSEDSDYFPEIKVCQNAVHEALVGEDLRINCTVTFCNNSPPTVSWYKLEKHLVPVNFNRSTHIKTEWKISKKLEGISFLVFQKILRNDSGQYQCQSAGGSVGHAINVSVYESTTPQNALWPYVYRVAGIVVFVIIVITIYVASKCGCKGVHHARKSKNTPDPSPQPLPGGSLANQHVLPINHIYENDPNVYENDPNVYENDPTVYENLLN